LDSAGGAGDPGEASILFIIADPKMASSKDLGAAPASSSTPITVLPRPDRLRVIKRMEPGEGVARMGGEFKGG